MNTKRSELYAELDRRQAKIDELQEALRGARGLIARHHNVLTMARLRSGGFCPVCVPDGSGEAPELVDIFRALTNDVQTKRDEASVPLVHPVPGDGVQGDLRLLWRNARRHRHADQVRRLDVCLRRLTRRKP